MATSTTFTAATIEALNTAKEVIEKNRIVAKRIEILSGKGFNIQEVPVQGGGVGTVFQLKKETRIQIGYAHGGRKGNYAQCIIIPA